jgi:hypothetical protein
VSVKRLRLVVVAAVTAVVVGGCGTSTAVPGSPLPAAGRLTSRSSPKPAPTVPGTTRQSPSSQPQTTTSSSTSTSAPLQGAAGVVQAYFDAINARDYQRAWALGGKNVGQSYSAFAAGFATTEHDTVTMVEIQGDTVTADLTATQVDGTTRSFHGTYTVTDGTITHFSVHATS